MEILTGGLCGVPGTGYEPMYKKNDTMGRTMPWKQ